MLCPPHAPDARGSGLQRVLVLLRLSISVKSELIGQWGGHFGECAAPFFLLWSRSDSHLGNHPMQAGRIGPMMLARL